MTYLGLTWFNILLKMVLTVKASQQQGKHFHTAGTGTERPGHNSAGQPCTPPRVAKGRLLSSNGLHTPQVSTVS